MAAIRPAMRTTLESYGNRPTARTKTIGYMAILWYQHSLQIGTSITSLKKRLPSVAVVTMSHAMNIRYQPVGVGSGELVLFIYILRKYLTHLVIFQRRYSIAELKVVS